MPFNADTEYSNIWVMAISCKCLVCVTALMTAVPMSLSSCCYREVAMNQSWSTFPTSGHCSQEQNHAVVAELIQTAEWIHCERDTSVVSPLNSTKAPGGKSSLALCQLSLCVADSSRGWQAGGWCLWKMFGSRMRRIMKMMSVLNAGLGGHRHPTEKEAGSSEEVTLKDGTHINCKSFGILIN